MVNGQGYFPGVCGWDLRFIDLWMLQMILWLSPVKIPWSCHSRTPRLDRTFKRDLQLKRLLLRPLCGACRPAKKNTAWLWLSGLQLKTFQCSSFEHDGDVYLELSFSFNSGNSSQKAESRKKDKNTANQKNKSKIGPNKQIKETNPKHATQKNKQIQRSKKTKTTPGIQFLDGSSREHFRNPKIAVFRYKKQNKELP